MLEQVSRTASFFQAMAPDRQRANGRLCVLLREDRPEGAKRRGGGTPHLFVADRARLFVHALRPLRLGRLPSIRCRIGQSTPFLPLAR
jgi:hypothetical protein